MGVVDDEDGRLLQLKALKGRPYQLRCSHYLTPINLAIINSILLLDKPSLYLLEKRCLTRTSLPADQ